MFALGASITTDETEVENKRAPDEFTLHPMGFRCNQCSLLGPQFPLLEWEFKKTVHPMSLLCTRWVSPASDVCPWGVNCHYETEVEKKHAPDEIALHPLTVSYT